MPSWNAYWLHVESINKLPSHTVNHAVHMPAHACLPRNPGNELGGLWIHCWPGLYGDTLLQKNSTKFHIISIESLSDWLPTYKHFYTMLGFIMSFNK